MTDEEKFIESLYEEANEQLKEVYKEKKEIRDKLLQEIAMIMLTYTIIDGVMNIEKEDRDKSYKKISSLILTNYNNICKNQINVLDGTLKSTVNKTFKFYNYNADLKDVKQIIESNFKGKHFSDRIWENENEVAKYLHKQVKNFLNGKANVNQIKNDIQKTFNTSAFNSKRLVETEVNRCSSKAFDKFCEETGVKKVRYNATLDGRLCNDCAQYHDKVFNIKDKVETPRHPLCRCFYTIEDDSNKHIMNLQLFGIDENKELQKLIDNGTVDEVAYNICYNYFDKKFKNGIKTPIDTVYNKKDRFVHIARRHPDMISNKEIDNISETLQYPDIILKTKDRFNNQAIGYIKKIENSELLVIVNNGIITSYYPSKNYLKNVKRGEVLWQKE